MNIFLNLIQKITHFGATEDDRSFLEEMSIWEQKLKNLPHTKHLIKTIRLSLEKVLEIEEINEKLNTLNMIKKRLFSEICIIKKFLSEINQLYEVQEDIERSFSKAETLWKQLKDLDNIVSQKLKEKNLYDYKKWKSKAQNDLEEYKKMRLNKLEKKKLDYDEQLRKFAQERKMLYENIKSIPSSSKEKASINLEEELKNIELPLILNELESFFGEIKEPDITNLTIFEKDDHKKHNPTIDIIEDEDFNSSE
ncbi:hypothetical protein PNEG_00755 [Pneumocystis murina B123]|uniref:Uncharacterized protein n=1 Tax=Pneumocystis murina (strain B123) TaxID=1069680 RepID=M7PL13_PNEMU|nr:hypothetical protein PNEG_00755 [Pneumocystis murina B123]EMR11159.1 hypothetical protein PNEG_00755 [Pneumocystis murina B123]